MIKTKRPPLFGANGMWQLENGWKYLEGQTEIENLFISKLNGMERNGMEWLKY